MLRNIALLLTFILSICTAEHAYSSDDSNQDQIRELVRHQLPQLTEEAVQSVADFMKRRTDLGLKVDISKLVLCRAIQDYLSSTKAVPNKDIPIIHSDRAIISYLVVGEGSTIDQAKSLLTYVNRCLDRVQALSINPNDHICFWVKAAYKSHLLGVNLADGCIQAMKVMPIAEIKKLFKNRQSIIADLSRDDKTFYKFQDLKTVLEYIFKEYNWIEKDILTYMSVQINTYNFNERQALVHAVRHFTTDPTEKRLFEEKGKQIIRQMLDETMSRSESFMVAKHFPSDISEQFSPESKLRIAQFMEKRNYSDLPMSWLLCCLDSGTNDELIRSEVYPRGKQVFGINDNVMESRYREMTVELIKQTCFNLYERHLTILADIMNEERLSLSGAIDFYYRKGDFKNHKHLVDQATSMIAYKNCKSLDTPFQRLVYGPELKNLKKLYPHLKDSQPHHLGKNQTLLELMADKLTRYEGKTPTEQDALIACLRELYHDASLPLLEVAYCITHFQMTEHAAIRMLRRFSEENLLHLPTDEKCEIMDFLKTNRSPDASLQETIRECLLSKNIPQHYVVEAAKQLSAQKISLQEVCDRFEYRVVQARFPQLTDEEAKDIVIIGRQQEHLNYLEILRTYVEDNCPHDKHTKAYMAYLVCEKGMTTHNANARCKQLEPDAHEYKNRFKGCYFPKRSGFYYQAAEHAVEANGDKIAGLAYALKHFSRLRKPKRFTYGSPHLQDQFYHIAAKRIWSNKKWLDHYDEEPNSFTGEDRIFIKIWDKHMVDPEKRQRRGSYFNKRKTWEKSFTDKDLNIFIDLMADIVEDSWSLFECMRDNKKISRQQLIDGFAPVLATYYTYVETVDLPDGMPLVHRDEYLGKVARKMLTERLKSFHLANTMLKSEFIESLHGIINDYPFLSLGCVQNISLLRIFRDEDTLRQMIFSNVFSQPSLPCLPEEVIDFSNALTEWFMDNKGFALSEGIDGFKAFLDKEEQDLIDRLWGLSRPVCHSLVWRNSVRQTPLTEALTDHLLSKPDLLVHFCPPELEGDEQPRKFVSGLAQLMVETQGPLNILDAARAHRRSWYRDELQERVHLPGPLLDVIADHITRTGCSPVQAIAQRIPELLQKLVLEDQSYFAPWIKKLYRITAENPISPLSNYFQTAFNLVKAFRHVKEYLTEQEEAWLQRQCMLIAEDMFIHRKPLLRATPKEFFALKHPAFNIFSEHEEAKDIFAAFQLMDIPPDDFELPDPSCLKSPVRIVNTTLHFCQQNLTSRDIFAMYPFELICRFRQFNNLTPVSVLRFEEEHAAKLKEGYLKASNRVLANIEACEQLHAQHQKEAIWKFDGRNPCYRTTFDQTLATYMEFFETRMKVTLLQADPYLKLNDIDQLIPETISEQEFINVRDSLLDLAQKEIKRAPFANESERERLRKEDDYKEKANRAITRFFHWYLPRTDYRGKPIEITKLDLSFRKRIVIVYRKLFEPYIVTGKFEDAMKELINIIEVGEGCQDGSQRALANLEGRPTDGLIAYENPTIFERLANILRELRLSCIEQVARSRAGAHDELLEFDLFLKIACNYRMSLLCREEYQSHPTCAGYNPEIFAKDVEDILTLYDRKLLPTVMKAIKYRGMPQGDRDMTTIYMEQIAEWAPNTRWYCNSIELDEDLLDQGKIKPQVVRRLVGYAGYIELDEK